MMARLLILVVFMGADAGAVTRIAPDTYFIVGEATPNRQPDGNSVVIAAPQGSIVFDTGRHPEHWQAILDFAHAQDRPIAAIVNSHWHLDHVGGNPQLRAAFPNLRVYASSAIDAARAGFLADYRAQLMAEIAGSAQNPGVQQSRRAEVALIDAGAALGPTDVVAKSARWSIAGRPLQLNLETRAVTAGDVWLFDPATKVLVAGDLVTLPAPFFETACPARWRDSLAQMEKTPFTLLVPGHGAPMRRQQFAVYRTAFSHLLDCAAGEAKNSDCVDGWVSDAAALMESSKDVSYARTLIGYYVDNYLRNTSERIRKFCSG